MLFTESQLRMNGNPMAVLNEATYLDENEALIRPQTIPIAENSRIGAYTVRFDDVHRLAESHGVSYIDAVVAIAESSGVDPAHLKVAVDEAEIICNPDVVLALPENGVVVAPLSENSLAFQYVTECIGLWDQMPDTDEADMALAEALIEDSYLEQFIQEAGTAVPAVQGTGSNGPSLKEKIGNAFGAAKNAITGKVGAAGQEFGALGGELKAAAGQDGIGAKAAGIKNAIMGHKAATVGGVAAVAGLGALLKKGKSMLTAADDKPKSWIGQKIAALRKVYQSWMQKAQQGGPGVGDKIKQAAAKLLSIIDALMKKMQHAAG